MPPPPPGGAVFGGYAHHATPRPAFLSPPASQPTSADASQDSRDEIGGQPSSAHQQYPYYALPSATFGVTPSIAAEFSPPHSTALRTAPSHDSADSSTTDQYLTEPMPALPSVPPSSSIHQHNNNSPQRMHVTFAPPAAYYTYDRAVPRLGYQYESYQYRPGQETSTTYPHNSETSHAAHPRNRNEDQSTSCEGTTVLDDEVTGRDVKFGRGGGTNRHPGNLFFRKLVEDAKPAYMLAKKAEKGQISRSIVSTIRSRGGRWLRFDRHRDLWEEVGDDEAAKKVSQALREGLALKRREALMKSVSTSRSTSRSKKSMARPAYLPSSKAKCPAKAKKQMME